MSLGARSVPFHKDPLAIGTFAAMEKGIFVSIAAGNSGPSESSLKNDAPWVLTVGASTMDRSIRSTVQLGSDDYFHGESLYLPSDSHVFYPLVYAGASGKPFAEFCDNGTMDGFDVKGKIVLCESGGNGSAIMKGAVVQSAGGAGMILMNEFEMGHNTFPEPHVLPASQVDYAAGSAMKSYINSTANPVARISFEGTILGTTPAPSIVFFSSRGPSLQVPGILKPDITGPGVNVLAAWPPYPVALPSPPFLPGPTFNFLSGTSMSTPHLAGIAAAIKSKHPDWSPAVIKSAMMTTADINDRSGKSILDEQYNTASFFATGAGHVNPVKAADPGLVYDITPEEYVGHLCGMYTSKEVTVIARRPINCSNVAVIDDLQLNYPSITVKFPTPWNTTTPIVIQRKVKNVGAVPSVYYAAVDMQDGPVTVDVYPRELEFTEANQEKIFSVVVWSTTGGAKIGQGALRWVSEMHTVRSPISFTFGPP
jgi:subtilisin family serine protease